MVPALRKEREGRGTHFAGDANEIKSLGHPPNKDPRDENDPGYIDFFYLEPHAQLQGRDWRVHYNQVATLPTATIQTSLLRKKVLQLDDRTRMKFKIKLGFTMMRVNEDERVAGLINPWAPPAPTPEAPPAPGAPPQN